MPRGFDSKECCQYIHVYFIILGGSQSRERLCNNPPVANGGQDCLGERVQTQSCNDDPCRKNRVYNEPRREKTGLRGFRPGPT